MKINGWYRIGIVLSLLWLVAGGWIYFYSLENDPIPKANCIVVDCYNWVTDESADNSNLPERFKFVKPEFYANGFIMFLVAPLAIMWALVLISIYTGRWVYAGFKA